MNQPILSPDLLQDKIGESRWMVTIFNNDWTPIQDVVDVLMTATGCTLEEAAIETWEAHHFGKAPVHFADQVECERAARVINAIGVVTEVGPEWND